MPVLTVRHLTRYRYRQPVAFGEHRLMLRPREAFDQRILSERLVIVPEPVSLRFVHDVFGNCVGIAHFDRPAKELSFESTVDLDHRPAPLPPRGDPAHLFPLAYDADDLTDLHRSIEMKHADPHRTLATWARGFAPADGLGDVLDLLSQMTHSIHDGFEYRARHAGGTQSPLQTLALRSGTCRDFAWLMIEAARSLGLAARFVSGYIYNSKKARTGGGHTHAWASVYLPRGGWLDFDPTNGIVGSTDLIRVAVARDSSQASPLSGEWDGDVNDYLGMDVDVEVRVKRAPAVMRRVA
jgi:transglutaminase-like putative cysteine protease